MDQIKIGGFITKERKRKNLTQQQLADLLGISNKTVSKWERGGGMPEISLLLPLCEALEISVNELLSGERLNDEEYRRKAEENMMNLVGEREENKKKFRLTIAVGVISTISFVTLILIASLFHEEMGLPVTAALFLLAVMIFAYGIGAAMYGDRTAGYYKCGRCGEKFVPGDREHIRSLHTLTKRRLKCPRCGEKSWCKKVMTKED